MLRAAFPKWPEPVSDSFPAIHACTTPPLLVNGEAGDLLCDCDTNPEPHRIDRPHALKIPLPDGALLLPPGQDATSDSGPKAINSGGLGAAPSMEKSDSSLVRPLCLIGLAMVNAQRKDSQSTAHRHAPDPTHRFCYGAENTLAAAEGWYCIL